MGCAAKKPAVAVETCKHCEVPEGPFGTLLRQLSLARRQLHPGTRYKIKCSACEKKYHAVNCPHCRGSNVWPDANYKHGRVYTCVYPACEKKFRAVNCPHCQGTNVWRNLNYIQGSVYTCAYPACEKKFQTVNCPHCQGTCFFLHVDYKQGCEYTCVYDTCGKKFQTAWEDPAARRPSWTPAHFTTSSGVTVIPDPDRVEEIQRLMSAAWKVKATRDRKTVAGFSQMPSGCRVVGLLRVEHHSTFAKYAQYREQVRRSIAPGGCAPFRVVTSDQRLNKLDESVNEMYLFHGTSPSAADAIARSDFKIFPKGVARSMFGRGIYLAEHASKSDEYSKEGEGIFQGQYAMLICRAIAGKVMVVEAPGDHKAELEQSGYDSLCGDRLKAVGTFREMVFFKEEAVVVEYIALYHRTYGASLKASF